MKCLIDNLFPRYMYNISDLCRYVGITRLTYYNILKSKSEPSVTVALKICDYFQNKVIKDDNIIIEVSDLFNIYT